MHPLSYRVVCANIVLPIAIRVNYIICILYYTTANAIRYYYNVYIMPHTFSLNNNSIHRNMDFHRYSAF